MNQRGGYEAWFNPTSSRHRKERQYICYAGKRKLANPPAEIEAVVTEEMKENGIG